MEVYAEGEEDFRAWEGWVHSRMRLLVAAMQQLVRVRPWPKTLKGPQGADGRRSCFHYLGIAKLPVRPPTRRRHGVLYQCPLYGFRVFRLRA